MITLRGAHVADIPLLVRGILEAEAVPRLAPTTTYEHQFGMSRAECSEFLRAALSEASGDHQLSLTTFQIALVDETPAGFCAGWVESSVRASGLSIAMLVSRSLGRDRWRQAEGAVRLLRAVTPARTGGAIQLESFWVDPRYRGRGVASALIREQITRLRSVESEPTRAEILLYVENAAAERAYGRAGFAPDTRSPQLSDDQERALGSSGLIKLSRTLPHDTTI